MRIFFWRKSCNKDNGPRTVWKTTVKFDDGTVFRMGRVRLDRPFPPVEPRSDSSRFDVLQGGRISTHSSEGEPLERNEPTN